MRRDPRAMAALPAAFGQMRASYQDLQTSRFVRQRRGLPSMGASADYHLANESTYLWMMEYVRDMVRVDALAGPLVERAVTNTVQNGFVADPKTGDDKLNLDLWQRFNDWASEADACDAAGDMTFAEMQEHAFRAMLVDGDIFALPQEDGTLQMVEAHRCRTPSRTKQNVAMGVLLGERRKRLEYWFTKDNLTPTSPVRLVSDIDRYPARDGAGNPLVFHVYDPDRVSQTRGVTAFAPVIPLAAMLEDINFAKLVQQQVASCFALLQERPIGAGGIGAAFGETETDTRADGSTETIENITPGMRIIGAPGDKFTGFSPNVPNAEYFQQVRLIIQLISINLGLPIIMVLMDASETNFSGWRGAVDEARRGFLRNQRQLRDRFHIPVYRWKVRQWMKEDAALRQAFARLGKTLFKVEWNTPRWPYIQPLQDAQADAARIDNRLSSPRRVHAERGQDADEIVAETVADNELALSLAIEAAKRIETKYGVKVDPMRLLRLQAEKPLDEQAAKTVTAGPPAEQPDNEEETSPPDDESPEDEPEETPAAPAKRRRTATRSKNRG